MSCLFIRALILLVEFYGENCPEGHKRPGTATCPKTPVKEIRSGEGREGALIRWWYWERQEVEEPTGTLRFYRKGEQRRGLEVCKTEGLA